MFHAARAVIFDFHRYDEEKHEKRIYVSIPIMTEDEILYGPRIKTEFLYTYNETARKG